MCTGPTEEEETNSNHVGNTLVTGCGASLAKLDHKFSEARGKGVDPSCRGVGFSIVLEPPFEGKDDLAIGL